MQCISYNLNLYIKIHLIFKNYYQIYYIMYTKVLLAFISIISISYFFINNQNNVNYPVQNVSVYGTLIVKISGVDKELLVTSHQGQQNHIQVIGNKGVKLSSSTNVQFATTSTNVYTPDMFYRFQLLGKKLIYDLDVSSVPCSCVAAFYFSNMPGYNVNNVPEPSQWGNYYCDANKVAGTFCPQMDATEANQFAHATTPHTCSLNQDKYWLNCDKGGCGANTQDNSGKFGPGTSFTINTLKPYNVAISFIDNHTGVLQRIDTVLSQDGKTYLYSPCNQNAQYLKTFGEQLQRGMVLVPSLWGSTNADISWLDGKTGCKGDCNYNINSFTFSNIVVEDL